MQEICQRARTIGGWFIQTRLANVQADLTHSFRRQEHSWKKSIALLRGFWFESESKKDTFVLKLVRFVEKNTKFEIDGKVIFLLWFSTVNV